MRRRHQERIETSAVQKAEQEQNMSYINGNDAATYSSRAWKGADSSKTTSKHGALSPMSAFLLYGTLLSSCCVAVFYYGMKASRMLVHLWNVFLWSIGLFIWYLQQKQKRTGHEQRERALRGEKGKRNRKGDTDDNNVTVPLISASNGQQTISETLPRIHFLDNLRSVLATIVVVLHVTCSFIGTGWYYMIGRYVCSFQIFGFGLLISIQSYCMVLFFFLSGYFCPSSLERKGVVGFLADRYKPLMIPYVVTFFGFTPLLLYWVHLNVEPRYRDRDGGKGTMEPYGYFAFPGHMWFVWWLLLFSIAYASIQKLPVTKDKQKEQRRPAPGPCRLVTYAFVLGMFQGLLVKKMRVLLFISMPLTFGSLPFHIAAFALGIQAKNNRWLEQDFPKFFFGDIWQSKERPVREKQGLAGKDDSDPSPCTATDSVVSRQKRVCLWRRIVLCISILSSALFFWGLAAHLMLTVGYIKPEVRTRALAGVSPTWILFFVDMVVYGISGFYTLIFCVTWLCIAGAMLNRSSPLLSQISSASYGVYIVHPWLVVLLTVAYVSVLEYVGAVANDEGKMWFRHGLLKVMLYSPTELQSEAFLWLGWLAISVLSVIISFLLAWSLKRIPMLSNIL